MLALNLSRVGMIIMNVAIGVAKIITESPKRASNLEAFQEKMEILWDFSEESYERANTTDCELPAPHGALEERESEDLELSEEDIDAEIVLSEWAAKKY